MRMKGQAETPFILSLLVFVAFVGVVFIEISAYDPTLVSFTTFDILLFATSIVGIAGSCAIATGLPCAGALVFFNAATFLTISNTGIYLLLFLPLTITTSYVLSRLARGGG